MRDYCRRHGDAHRRSCLKREANGNSIKETVDRESPCAEYPRMWMSFVHVRLAARPMQQNCLFEHVIDQKGQDGGSHDGEERDFVFFAQTD